MQFVRKFLARRCRQSRIQAVSGERRRFFGVVGGAAMARATAHTAHASGSRAGLPGSHLAGMDGGPEFRLRTPADAEAAMIPANVTTIHTQFHSPRYADRLSLVGGARYSRRSKTDIERDGYPRRAYFRSADRFMPDGSSDATNGGYWVISEPDILPVAAFGGHAAATSAIFTEAAQAALDTQGILAAAISGGPRGGSRGYAPEVLFPTGQFSIDEELLIKTRYAIVRGNQTVLRPSDSFRGAACFRAAGSLAWRNVYSNLQIMDFSYGLYLDTDNTNRGNIVVEDCAFYNHSIDAVYLSAQSAYVEFNRCRWHNNKHELRIADGDHVIVNGGWITRGLLTDDYDGGIVVEASGSRLHMLNVLGVPVLQSVEEPCWVKWSGRYFFASRCRFGGEDGGHTVVNNHTARDKAGIITPVELNLRDCTIYCASDDKGAVRLFDIPNVVRIQGCVGFPSDQRIVTWSGTLDGAAQAAKITDVSNDEVNQSTVLFEIDGNAAYYTSISEPPFPANLAKFASRQFTGAVVLRALHDAPTPPTGALALWVSDGAGSGSAGDLMAKDASGNVTVVARSTRL